MAPKCPYMTNNNWWFSCSQTAHPLVNYKMYIAAVYVHAILLNKISLSSTGSNDSAPESTYNALGK